MGRWYAQKAEVINKLGLTERFEEVSCGVCSWKVSGSRLIMIFLSNLMCASVCECVRVKMCACVCLSACMCVWCLLTLAVSCIACTIPLQIDTFAMCTCLIDIRQHPHTQYLLCSDNGEVLEVKGKF